MPFLKAGATGPQRLDISYPTTEFTKLVKLWDKYDEATMGIFVRHIKRYGQLHRTSACTTCCLLPTNSIPTASICRSSLPDMVFGEGERQPKQTLKRTKSNKVRMSVLIQDSICSAVRRDPASPVTHRPTSRTRSRRSTKQIPNRQRVLNGRRPLLGHLSHRLRSKALRQSSRNILSLPSLLLSLPQLLNHHHQESLCMRLR